MRASTRLSAAPTGQLVAVFVVGAFLLAGLTGSLFSLHVGMTSESAAVAGIEHVAEESAAHTAGPMPVGHDSGHLMHLMGSCLTVLTAAVVLLLMATGIQRFLERQPIGRTLRGAMGRARETVWTPSTSPPRSSPVIRT